MANFRSIPLVLTGSGADIRRITPAEEILLAPDCETFIRILYPASNDGSVTSRNYQGSLDRFGTRVADSDMLSIGSFTDTSYNQAVGTHPGTSLTTATVVTSLSQCFDSSATNAVLNYPTLSNRLVALDSDGDFRELDSAHTISFGKRLLETSLANENVGAFRVGTTTPTGGTWEKWNTDAFSDTTSSTTTNYHVYRKTLNAVSDADSITVMHLDTTSDVSIKEFSAASTNISLSIAVQMARVNSELGKMILLPSSQTPASVGQTGTWQTRGTMTDTKNLTESINYSTDFFLSYSSEQFTGQYSGTYVGTSFVDVPTQFAGSRVLTFAGSRTNYQTGATDQFSTPRAYAAQYVGSRTFSDQYVGTRQFNGTRAFQNIQYDQYSGFRTSPGVIYFQGPRYFTGASDYYSRQFYFTGQRSRQFAGNRWVNVPGLGNFFNQFLRIVNGNFTLGQQQFAGTRQSIVYTGENNGNNPDVLYFVKFANFTGARFFSGSRLVGFVGTRNYGGQREFNFTGFRSFLGSRQSVGYFYFAGQRTFGGQYAGSRLISTRYVGTAPFTSNNTNYVGSRTFSDQYAGSRTKTLVFAGARQFDNTYSRNSAVQRAGTVPTTFTGSFTGQYSGQYTREYVGQNSQQFAGDTLTSTSSVIETYTLYCKVSES